MESLPARKEVLSATGGELSGQKRSEYWLVWTRRIASIPNPCMIRWASSFHRWLVVDDFLYEPAGDFHTQQWKKFVHAAEVDVRGFLQRLQLTGFVTTE